MKKFDFVNAVMMKMYMCVCCMYMCFCVFISEMFSILNVKLFPA